MWVLQITVIGNRVLEPALYTTPFCFSGNPLDTWDFTAFFLSGGTVCLSSTPLGEWGRERYVVTTFHSHEARSFTLCESNVKNILSTGYLLCTYGNLTCLYFGCTQFLLPFETCRMGLHIARTNYTVIDNIYLNVYTFQFGPFDFRLTECLEYECFPDYFIPDVTRDGVTVPFHITIVIVCAQCESQSSTNFADFIWKHICVFAVKMYAIVCVPLRTPTVLYLNHHRAVSDRWTSDILCDESLEENRLILQPFVGNCT